MKIRGQLTPEDFIEAYCIDVRPSSGFYLGLAIFLMLAVGAPAFLFFNAPPGYYRWVYLALIPVCFGLHAYAGIWAPRNAIRKRFARLPFLCEPHDLDFTDQGITSSGSQGSYSMSWRDVAGYTVESRYTKVIESERGCVHRHFYGRDLVCTSSHIPGELIFPRRWFSDAEYNRFRKYLSTHLGRPEDQLSAKERIALYRQAADQGSAAAQYNLAIIYFLGDGVPKDLAQSAIFARRAAEQGYPLGQAHLGWHYQMGKGLEKDLAQAAHWYGLAAEQGNAIGQNNFGELFAIGEGVARDDAQALLWYRKAADQNLSFAQRSVGEFYRLGRGTARDPIQAALWLRRSASQGDEPALHQLIALFQEEHPERDCAKIVDTLKTEARREAKKLDHRLPQAIDRFITQYVAKHLPAE